MLLTLSTTGLLYAACVALYHAHPGRSWLEWLRSASARPWLLRVSAVALIAGAFLLLASQIGWERAVPVALGVLAGAGILCVLAAVFTPKTHVAGATLALAIGTLASLAVLFVP